VHSSNATYDAAAQLYLSGQLALVGRASAAVAAAAAEEDNVEAATLARGSVPPNFTGSARAGLWTLMLFAVIVVSGDNFAFISILTALAFGLRAPPWGKIARVR
jgi:hypothetical protein